MRRRYVFRDFVCPDGHKTHKFVEDGENIVMCESAGCEYAALRPKEMIGLSAAMHGDELDYIDHNLGPVPIHIRSKSERRRIMKERGLMEFIRHTPVPGTNKSPHTISWDTMDPQTMENARILVSRQGGHKVQPSPVDEVYEPVANAFSLEPSKEDANKLIEAINGKSVNR